jgi:hypothetical protein
MNLTTATTFRRMACGLCLLVGPALLLAATIVDPSAGEGGETRDYLAALADDPDMAQLSTALWIYGFALMAIGIIGVVHVIRGRGVTLANVGGAFALFGMIMFVALVTTTINEINQAEHLDLRTAERLSDDIEDYWAAYVVLVPALLGTLIGFILLAAAIIRSRLAHVAAAVLIILGILMVPATEDSRIAGIVANLLLLAGWGLVGLKLLGMKDEQWEGREPLEPEPAIGSVPPPAV